MNNDLQFIFSRRSIRKYTGKTIPKEILQDILEAAMAAPSAVAKDPWHFLVIQERPTLNNLAAILPHGTMLRNAAAGIVVCGDINRAHDKQESYLLQDLSAAVENLLLAANVLGLGACWLGVHPRQERISEIKRLFSLPAHILPMCAISLGWPAEKHAPRTRFREDCVHIEKW